jgi:hypothetical protein
VQTELGELRGNRAYTWPVGGAVDVLLRPDDIVYAPDSALKARIVGKTFLGASTLYRLQLPTGAQLESIFPSHVDHQVGVDVGHSGCGGTPGPVPGIRQHGGTDSGRRIRCPAVQRYSPRRHPCGASKLVPTKESV